MVKKLKKILKWAVIKYPILIYCATRITELPNEGREDELVFERFPDKELFIRFRKHERESTPNFWQGKRKYILTDCNIMPSTERRVGKVIHSLDAIPQSQIENSIFYIYFKIDSDVLPILKKLKKYGGQYISHFNASKTDYRFVNRLAYNALRKTWAKSSRISHLIPIVHENICEALELTKNIKGDYVEIGVFRGGSALTALNYLKELNRPRKVWLLDTFDGFNYQEARDSQDIFFAETHTIFGIEETKKYVSETLQDAGNFKLVESNICSDELPGEIKEISVANIDVDMYEATASAIKKCAPKMAIGGIMICEDPASTPLLYGAYLAMNEFLESPMGKHFMPIFKGGGII